ncbi:hypothetical protein J3R30DRAFT_3455971 [Lentinula aciculospora]|uniref:Zinc-finger domain-containing protein n=1 Tax=Lentinula aciculospora TaxID=153920 RepID=A0A9W9AGF6_9AGAR|nr:hypothetical protein J3R30DRAFT_3455971 [Lentinula aciculospora]
MSGTSQNTGAESSTFTASAEDAASSLRAAALLTLKKPGKRRKTNVDQAQSAAHLIRPAAVDNSVQLDYGQDDGDTDIASSPAEKPSSLQQQSISSTKILDFEMEDGQVREEGEISDSEEPASVNVVANARPKVPTTSPTSKRPAPPTPPHNHHLPSSTFSPEEETSSHSLLDRMSTVPLPSSKSPQRVESSDREQTDFVDVDHVRPGLEMNQDQYNTAKDIILDLLGWGVAPEYLIDCGLSREIVFHVFSELNLRLPKNLNPDGIIPYTPSTLKALFRVSKKALTPFGSDPGIQPHSGHPSLPPKPEFPGHDRSRDRTPKATESDADRVAALHDMERQRRQELLARKAVQASRKTRNTGSISPTSKPMDVDDKDVEMAPLTSLAPSESVDDFLRSIEPVESGKADVDKVSGLGSTSTLEQRDESIDRMVESPYNQASFPPQTEDPPMSSVDTSEQSSCRSSPSEDTSGPSNGLARRNGKRPVAADFVDFDAPRDRSGSVLRRKTGSFASISTMRRCVIDLSDSEGELDGEDVQMKSVPVPTGTTSSRYSTPPTYSVAATAHPDYRTMSPAALAVKELEIQKMRQMIAEREQGRRRKLKKLEAMSTPDDVIVKQEEEDSLASFAIPVIESPSTQSAVTINLTSQTAEIGNDAMNPEPLVTSTAESQEESNDSGINRATTETIEKSPTVEAVDVDLLSSSSAQTTPDLSQHPQKLEEKVLQPEKHEQDISSYISIFDSFPLLRSKPPPILERGTDIHPSSSSVPSFKNTSASSSSPLSFLSPTASFSSYSSSLSFAVRLLRLATVSRLLDPSKRVCQYEIPGGGICRDAGCEDFHIDRMFGTSTGLTITEPSDQDTANYLSSALPDRWIVAYRSSLSSRILATLEDDRVNNPTTTLEERVARILNLQLANNKLWSILVVSKSCGSFRP